MEKFSSLFHSETSPEFESFVVEKKVKVLLIKFVQFLFLGNNLFSFERLSTNVLYFVIREVQSLCDHFVGEVFVRLSNWLSSSEPKHKGSLTKFILKSWCKFLKLHCFLNKNIL